MMDDRKTSIADGEDVPKPSDAQDRPLSTEETLDESLTDSMDASDPPAATQPGDHGEPVPSSGFTKEDEEAAEKASAITRQGR